MTKKPLQLERIYDASLEDVWELWTTKEGIESWWGPDGFGVEVLELDVRPGGHLRYAMTATAEPQIAFMKKAGMPLTTTTGVTYTTVARHERLTLLGIADFTPGVAPYETNVTVDFAQAANGVRVVVALAPMHDEVWTGRMAAGWESQLGRLEKVVGQSAR